MLIFGVEIAGAYRTILTWLRKLLKNESYQTINPFRVPNRQSQVKIVWLVINNTSGVTLRYAISNAGLPF